MTKPDKAPETHKDEAPSKIKGEPKRRRRGAQPSISKIGDELDSTIGAIGVAVMMTGDEYCGTIILERGQVLTGALVTLAKQNPRVKKLLSAMVKTSTWTGVTMASLSILLPVAAHHGLIPEAAAAIFLKGHMAAHPETEADAVPSDNDDKNPQRAPVVMERTPGEMGVATG